MGQEHWREHFKRRLVLELDHVRPQNDTPPSGFCTDILPALHYGDDELPLGQDVSLDSHWVAHGKSIPPTVFFYKHTGKPIKGRSAGIQMIDTNMIAGWAKKIVLDTPFRGRVPTSSLPKFLMGVSLQLRQRLEEGNGWEY